MSYQSGRSSKANPLAEVNKHKYASVSKYVEKITEWRMWPSRIRDGIVYIVFHGHEVEYSEFIKLQPSPNVSDFKSDLTNIDSTTTCLQ